jgi:hypothetical protein
MPTPTNTVRSEELRRRGNIPAEICEFLVNAFESHVLRL